MRWDDTYQSSNACYRWYDLLAGEGTENDELLGYVRNNLANGEFIAQINNRNQLSKKFDNLEDAKNHILTYYVLEKLEDT